MDNSKKLLAQFEADGDLSIIEDANNKFLRSLPSAWSNLAMTMRTKPDVNTLSIDDLYNNLKVFEQELTSTSKSSVSAQNVAFVSHSKSSTNKVKSGHTGAYNTYTPSTSSNNIPSREVPARLDDLDIEENGNKNWQIAMIAIQMKKFYKKTCLWYPRESPFDLKAYSDNDYGGSNLDRKSITCGCQFLEQRLITWQCKKQTIVATSTTEAEYVAAANCYGQVLWVQNQLLDYGFNFMNTKIHIDNESTICIVKNPVYHSKTKHIEIRHHFIRDCYEKKLISVEKIHTDLNVADLLTKPFDGPRFNYLVHVFLCFRLILAGIAWICRCKAGVIRYALSTNPTIYDSLVKQFWQTATANTIADGTLELHATIDTTEYTITEASIRDKLHLADASGITMLPNNEIFEGMGQMGYPTDGSFTFWKSFFTPQWRFLVHHLLHCISSKSGGWDQFGSNIATALICLSTGRVYNFSKLIFDGMVANLKSKTKFLMYPRFLQLILDIQTENKHPYLAVTLTKKIFGNMKRGFRGVPRPLLPAMLLVTNPNAGQEHPDVAQSQPSSSTIPVPSTSLPPEQSPPPIPTPIPASTPTPIPETDPEPMEHTVEEPSPAHQHFSPPQEHAQEQIKSQGYPNRPFGKAILTLVERVKTLEVALKRKTKRVLLSDSEEEETKAQGRKFHDLDPLVSLLQELVTPSKTPSKTVNASREEQVEDISPTTLEAAVILQKVKSAFEKVSTGGIKVSSGIEELKGWLKRKELTEDTKRKRKAQVQFEVQSYTEEDWDTIRAKLEANAELKESVLGKDLTVEDYAKRMVELNQGTWNLTQLKKLNFEEVKAKFGKLVKQLDTYVPMNFEATKESLKRFGEELQTKTAKKLKFDDEEPIPAPPIFCHEETCYEEPGMNLKRIYMLIEKKYPLSAEVCKAMLDNKLQGGKPDKDCYKLLKMMEKQAGAKGLTSPEQMATVEMVFSRPWICTFLVAKGLATPELMANW
ncbi:hypothetical protein Tco_0232577 [Tanacetum coccineum]